MGARIRALRRDRGLTLVQLARLSGMSQPFLSLAERGHARLSLASMARIAGALEVPAGSLLAREPERRVSGAGLDVVAAVEPRAPAGERTVWQLAQLPGGLFGTEFWGRDAEFGEYAVHDEDEFLYLLDGRLEVGLDDDTVHPLGPGDSMALAAGTAHAWRSASPGGYRLVTVTAGASRSPHATR